MGSSFKFNGTDLATYGLTFQSHNLSDFALQADAIPLTERAYGLTSRRPALNATLDVTVTASDRTTLLGYLDKIKAVLNVDTDKKLEVGDITDRYFMVRSGQMQKRSESATYWQGTITFARFDVLAYDNTEKSNNYTIATDPDSITETITGTANTRPVITITSNADMEDTTIEIESATTGETFQWTGIFNTGDVLVIDCQKMYVTFNTIASMLSTGPEYLALKPGANIWNTSGFTGVLNIKYRNRYV